MKAAVSGASEAACCDVRCAVCGAAVVGSAVVKAATMIRAAAKNARRYEAHTVIERKKTASVVALRRVMLVCGVCANVKAAIWFFRWLGAAASG